MGGCCCHPRSDEVTTGVPRYYYISLSDIWAANSVIMRTSFQYPSSEGHDTLPSPRSTASAVRPGLLVDTNLDSSIPDTFQAPPPPLPYDEGTGLMQTSRGSGKIGPVRDTSEAESLGEPARGGGRDTLVSGGDQKESNKIETEYDPSSPKACNVEKSKLIEPIVPTTDEEDVCPTCLEEYDKENPRIITKCEHHFHLACILEWMERSETCPVCDKEMIIDESFGV
ncbi:probable E3 ubiquitin-protein ligase RHB1A isoform X1 [Amborella trichopoda]|uniref:probable E3 ubiquitin-protein ligase RHB1A isoform X1 n=1 Tax=Amborella trichopoda TaxID=13333 RepID=UPI0005D41594|nr:probable E3 ubiquitin-protein ligase RHB1A isoform X1 [Amborella trichopoda]|eukprot:XP_011624744.1 probable E3 ubiquitin-protein ligase RHB1A isoform X1 [Amborella trichopoda]